MSSRPAVKSAFQNLRPTIMREPNRSTVSVEAEERLLTVQAKQEQTPFATIESKPMASIPSETSTPSSQPSFGGALLLKKKRERLLLVSFRMPQGLKEKLEHVAKTHEINQTDIINEAIELNLQRYM
jgi:hypothetical protein